MEKEKLLDKFNFLSKKILSNKKCLFSDIFFTILLISALKNSSLFIFIIILMTVHIARYKDSLFNVNKYFDKVLTYFYITLPNYSLIYISTNIKNSDDIFLWIFFLILLTKISGYFFRNILAGKLLSEKFHKTKTFGEIIGSLGVSAVIGLISSLFLKQKIIKFLIINIIIGIIVHIQDILNYKMKEKNCFIECYNNIALVSIFLWIYLVTNMIKII